MPGYLTNRYIKFNPAAEAEAVAEDLVTLEARVLEAEGNIEDLQLNLGV